MNKPAYCCKNLSIENILQKRAVDSNLVCLFKNRWSQCPRWNVFNFIPYDPIWCQMIPYNPIWSHMIPYNPIGSFMIPNDPIWSHIIPYNPLWSHMMNPCIQGDHQDQEEDGAQAGKVQHVVQQVQQLAKLWQQWLDDQILGWDPD